MVEVHLMRLPLFKGGKGDFLPFLRERLFSFTKKELIRVQNISGSVMV